MAVFPTGAINTRPAGASGSYSLRLNDDDSAYLSRTPSSAGNRKTWTWSGWVKRSNLSSNKYFFQARIDDTSAEGNKVTCYFMSNNKIRVLNQVTVWKETSAVFRDTSAWYHIVVRVDTTQSTASNRVRIYINGEEAAYDADNAPSQNADLAVNSTNAHYIGQEHGGYSYFDGYLADVYFIDGQSLAPSNFGETNSTYGNWQPITDGYTGTYGTNGFYLNFSDSGSIGTDSSGNSNDWTASNLASTDVVLDSTTNNFATMNSVTVNGTGVLSEGNLEVYSSGDSGGGGISTMSMASGKWYVEGYVKSVGANTVIGLAEASEAGNYTIGYAPSNVSVVNCESLRDRCAYRNAGGSYTTLETLSGTYTTGDVIGIAVDMDNGRVYFSKNNGWMDNSDGWTNSTPTNYLDLSLPSISEAVILVGNANATTPSTWILNFGQDSSFAGQETAQGNTDGNSIGDFYYEPPTGYLALCTANLPDPAVIPSQNFNTVTWAGDGSTSRGITGVGFQPDFTWLKGLNSFRAHELVDVVRGGDSNLLYNLGTYTNQAEDIDLSGNYNGSSGFGAIKQFDSDGFTVRDGNSGRANVNASSENYVAWNWKANGSGVSNTNGSITSTVSANQDAGFSIVGYTGVNTAGTTVGHGLSQVPEMIIVKNRTYDSGGTGSWQVYHKGIDATAPEDYKLTLDSDAARTDTSTRWNDTAPTSTVFTLGSDWDVNYTGFNFIAYCFHSVDGFSKFGSYIGNSVDDEPFIYTGFRPAFVIFKNATDSGSNWALNDGTRNPYNPTNKGIIPNSSTGEETSSNRDVDFLSNGFKIRTYSNDYIGGTNRTYIYMAFAEHPFKYTNAR